IALAESWNGGNNGTVHANWASGDRWPGQVATKIFFGRGVSHEAEMHPSSGSGTAPARSNLSGNGLGLGDPKQSGEGEHRRTSRDWHTSCITQLRCGVRLIQRGSSFTRTEDTCGSANLKGCQKNGRSDGSFLGTLLASVIKNRAN